MRWEAMIGELAERASRGARGLAGQMLALTVMVVIAVDALLLPPSLGNFHDNWLQDRVDAAYSAAVVAEAADASHRRDLLSVAGVSEIVLHRPGAPTFRLQGVEPDAPTRTVDLRRWRVVRPMADALSMLVRRRREYLRVIAPPRDEPDALIETVVREIDLKIDLGWHARRALLETLIASLLAGACLYAALVLLVVRRIRRMTGAIEAFGKRPGDLSLTAASPPSDDELGRAEAALGRMSEEVRAALRQKERLAGLGAAVAKIAHDLRNSLAAAQLVSERLSGSDDPKVRQSAPRLERAIARAVALAEAALRFGKADEPRPTPVHVNVYGALDEAADEALARHPDVAWSNAAPPLGVRADPDALHRILSNLIRNAAEAVAGVEGPRIVASAAATGDAVEIDIEDNGPGVPAGIREQIFQPFATAQRPSGVGLGLAIARELARAQGGDVELVTEHGGGARFRVTLPASVA
jgi:signal transduction histidine kinase